MREKLARLIAAGTAILVVAAALLFGWHQQSRMASLSGELDPEAWAELYPLHHASFMRGAEQDAGEPYDKLEANPFRRRAWAGNAFALEYNAARSHYYAQIDQRQSLRTRERQQPAGCINCHAAEAPQLIEQYGWDALHAMTYDEISDQVHVGSSCLDCHDPGTMELRISRPAFTTAMEARGIDITQASHQDMRSYVCAQCHVEYYFRDRARQLQFPWTDGIRLEDIERYYEQIDFTDWQHAETGADMIKIQHPEFELYSAGVHAEAGVACADCHMPRTRRDGVLISDHWIRSPMGQLDSACMNCHRGSAARLAERTASIQQNTQALLDNTERSLGALMDRIVAARDAGASDGQLDAARLAHRRAQLRWDFIDAENSTGFHAAGEAVRILADAVEIADGGRRSLGEQAPAVTSDRDGS